MGHLNLVILVMGREVIIIRGFSSIDRCLGHRRLGCVFRCIRRGLRIFMGVRSIRSLVILDPFLRVGG